MESLKFCVILSTSSILHRDIFNNLWKEIFILLNEVVRNRHIRFDICKISLTYDYVFFLQDREFVENDLAFNGAAITKPSVTPPLTPSPSINSLDNPGRQSSCCARRANHKKYQVTSFTVVLLKCPTQSVVISPPTSSQAKKKRIILKKKLFYIKFTINWRL